MLATAPAAMAGANDVVKMKPAHRTDRIADIAGSGDIAAHDAETLGEGAIDDIDAMHHALLFGEPAAARAVKSDRMHLVEIGQGSVFLSQVANGADGRH